LDEPGERCVKASYLQEMAKEIHQISDLTMIRDIARVFNELLRLSTLAEKQHRIRRWVIADLKKK